MGTSRSAPELLGKLDRVAKAVADPRPGITAAGKHARLLYQTEAAKAGVGRGVGKTKVSGKVTTRLNIAPDGRQAKVGYSGPVHLINNATKPHLIQPRKFVGTRGSGARAQKGAALLAAFGLDAHSTGRGGIAIPGVGVRRAAHHPGTKGKHFAEKAKVRAVRECPKEYGKAGITNQVKQALR